MCIYLYVYLYVYIYIYICIHVQMYRCWTTPSWLQSAGPVTSRWGENALGQRITNINNTSVNINHTIMLCCTVKTIYMLLSRPFKCYS